MISQDELRNMLNDEMEMSGEDFEVVRGGETWSLKGVRHTQQGTNRKYVQFYPDTNINVGDSLIRKISGDNKWRVIEVDPHIISGMVFSINVYYQTDLEREKQQPLSVSYTFNNSSNIIAGNQAVATLNVDIGKIEADIEERGGPDKEELLAMVMEIKKAFEKQDPLPKGLLARFSETLEKHSWITGSLVQLIGTAAIQFFIR